MARMGLIAVKTRHYHDRAGNSQTGLHRLKKPRFLERATGYGIISSWLSPLSKRQTTYSFTSAFLVPN